MIRHHFIVILRNFSRYRTSFIINLLGLATGLTCAILIALWVADEYRIDNFHALDERLYTVLVHNQLDGQVETSASTEVGLFGLAAFTAERGLKEIGIRKVIGSREWQIVYLISADFLRIVLLSGAIALPLAFAITRSWLSRFAYRIDLHWWYFPAAGLAALVVALLTVGFQAIKASRVNPVQCLKDE